MLRPSPVARGVRAVAASDAYGLLRASIRFKVGEPTLKRWRRRSREAGSLAPSPMGGDRRAGARTAKAVAAAVEEKPDRLHPGDVQLVPHDLGTPADRLRCLPRPSTE